MQSRDGQDGCLLVIFLGLLTHSALTEASMRIFQSCVFGFTLELYAVCGTVQKLFKVVSVRALFVYQR